MHGALGMASKRRRIIEPRSADDVRGATPERLAKAAGAIEIGGDERGAVRIMTVRDSPIERAKDRGVITERQYQAAEKYRIHWYRAGLSAPLQSLDLDKVFASDAANFSGMAKTEAQAFHRQRYREAVQLIGATNSAFLESVVCMEIPLSKAGQGLKWKHEKSAIVAATERLRTILDLLRELWGLQ